MNRTVALTLAGIFAIAVGLRLWGIAYGLPYDLTADEPHQIVQALKIGTGSGGPLVRMWHTIGKGGLDYLLFFEYSALFAFWWLTGRVDGPQAFALQYLTQPTAFYLVGRVTVAALGALTCLAVFAVGRRMYGTRVALGAAFLAAVSYYHSSASHVINVHIPMTCALWAGIAAYMSYEATGRRRTLLVSGLLVGAAIALAYSAAIGLLLLVGAILFPANPAPISTRVKNAAMLGGAALVSIALMSPDLLTGAALLIRNFTGVSAQSDGADIRSAIDSVTILRQQDWTGFAQLFLKPDAFAATLGAIVGAIVGIWRRERWTVLLSVATALFITVVSMSNRGLSEMYLLPVVPAVWLLCSHGVAALTLDRRLLYLAGIAAIGAASLFITMREDVMLAKPDTRVLAKQWIETHVPAGARILMDGMRFRFVQGVPLNPDKATTARRLADLEKSELTLSKTMLAVYSEAAERIDGPTYELHSTVYGLEVEDLDYYVQHSFDYVVVSSFNEKRYATELASHQHPKSARFYRDIKSDARFQAIYEIGPLMWQQVGPTITVYKVVAEPPVTDVTKVS